MSKTHWVYALCEAVTHDVRYVGCAVSPYKRLSNHMGNVKPCNEDLGAWIASYREQGICPGLLILEKTDNGRDGLNREQFWIEKYHADGANLFNRRGRPGWVKPQPEPLFGNTHAGRIRRALEKHGWDAPPKVIQAEVGEVIHFLKGHNRVRVRRYRRWYWDSVDDPKPALLPLSYIYAIRRQGRKKLIYAEGT